MGDVFEMSEAMLEAFISDVRKLCDESSKRISIKPIKLVLGEAWLSQFDRPQQAYDCAIKIMSEHGYGA